MKYIKIVLKLNLILIISVLWLFNGKIDAHANNRVGINVGDHFGEVDQAAQIVGSGGWIVIMAQPGDCDALSGIIRSHPEINFIIRGHYPDTSLTEAYAKAWASTLGTMDTGGKKVYFYPINEPDLEGISAPNAISYTNALISYLNSFQDGNDRSIRNNKVILLSPSITQSNGNISSYISSLGGASYFSQFDGISVSLYDFEDCGSVFCDGNPPLNAINYNYALGLTGVSKPIYAVESGVVKGETRVNYDDTLLYNFFQQAHGAWGGNLIMGAVFSYDPEHQQNWSIYGSQTAGLFTSIAAASGGNSPPPASSFDEKSFVLKNQSEITNCCSIAGEVSEECVSTSSSYILTGNTICDGPLDEENVGYRGEVIGFNGTSPFIVHGERGLGKSTSQKSGQEELSGAFFVSAIHYEHDVLEPITLEYLGSPMPSSDRYIEASVSAFKWPSFLRYTVPGDYIEERRFQVQPQPALRTEGETYTDLLKRRAPGNEAYSEVGIRATTINTNFLGCIQAVGSNEGLVFPMNGRLDFIEPPELHGTELWSMDSYQNLVAIPCQEGDSDCDDIYRFSPNYKLASANNDSRISQLAVETNTENTGNLLLDKALPKPSYAAECNAGSIVNLSVYTDQPSSPTGIFDVGYDICTVDGGSCNLRDIQITINGITIGPEGTSTSYAGQCWGAGSGGKLPGFSNTNLIGGLVITGCIEGGREGSVDDGCHDEGCFPQKQCTSCTITAKLVGGVYVPEATCELGQAPVPRIVNCHNCAEWAPPRYCPQIQAENITRSPECYGGPGCQSSIITRMGNISCGAGCLDSFDGLGNLIGCLWDCLVGETYELYVSPRTDFIADLNRYRTTDMGVFDSFAKLSDYNSELFEPEPSKAPIDIQLTADNNFNITGGNPATMQVEYTDHFLQVRKYCLLNSFLSLPGQFPSDPNMRAVCEPVEYGLRVP